MIYLDLNSNKIKIALKQHEDGLLKILINRVKKCTDLSIQSFLTDENVKKILVGKPEDIIKINKNFYDKVQGLSSRGYSEFLLNVDKSEKNLTSAQKRNLSIYKKKHLFLEEIFNYSKSFSLKVTKYSTYSLADNLKINSCVYCNRMYTKTVFKPDKITRPEFDHWFPKKKYPLLALSFYNLIPSCHICNSTLKGDNILNLTDFFHPYVDSAKTINKEFRFSYYNKTLNTYGFDLITNTPKALNTANAFKIKEIYETHLDEIKDLRQIRDVYSDRYIQNLSKLCKGAISEEEIYRLAFGVHKKEVDFEQRPLSKMKRDILIELGIIVNEK